MSLKERNFLCFLLHELKEDPLCLEILSEVFVEFQYLEWTTSKAFFIKEIWSQCQESLWIKIVNKVKEKEAFIELICAVSCTGNKKQVTKLLKKRDFFMKVRTLEDEKIKEVIDKLVIAESEEGFFNIHKSPQRRFF